MTPEARQNIELDIIVIVALDDPQPLDVLELYQHFLRKVDIAAFTEIVNGLVRSGMLSEFGYNVRYLQLTEMSRQRAKDVIGSQPATLPTTKREAGHPIAGPAAFNPMIDLLNLVDEVLDERMVWPGAMPQTRRVN